MKRGLSMAMLVVLIIVFISVVVIIAVQKDIFPQAEKEQQRIICEITSKNQPEPEVAFKQCMAET